MRHISPPRYGTATSTTTNHKQREGTRRHTYHKQRSYVHTTRQTSRGKLKRCCTCRGSLAAAAGGGGKSQTKKQTWLNQWSKVSTLLKIVGSRKLSRAQSSGRLFCGDKKKHNGRGPGVTTGRFAESLFPFPPPIFFKQPNAVVFRRHHL